jgi:hypothetical protein
MDPGSIPGFSIEFVEDKSYPVVQQLHEWMELNKKEGYVYGDLIPEYTAIQKENWDKLIQEGKVEKIVLDEKDWKMLIEHLKNPPEPVQALKDLFKDNKNEKD